VAGESATEADGAIANVSRFLDEQARDRPDRLALAAPRGRRRDGGIDYVDLDFAALAAERDAWAARLRAAGARRGTRVLLMARPGLPLIALCFACFGLGAAPVAIDPGMGLRRFLACVRRSRPEVVAGIPLALWASRVFRGAFGSVSGRVRLGRATERIARPGAAPPLALERAGRRDVAAILFTSGSTGPAKGVVYEHGMFEAQVAAIRSLYAIEPGEIDFPMLPIFALFNPALGMATVVPEIDPSRPAAADPARIVQAMRQRSVTNAFGSPVLWAKIADHCEAAGLKLPTLRRALMAGASAPPSLMRRCRDLIGGGRVHAPYGATEALPATSIGDAEVLGRRAALSEAGRGSCVGRPAPGAEVRVVALVEGPLEAERLERPLAAGEVGEVVVAGPMVTRAYDGLPEETRLAKAADRSGRLWHRMGDLGCFDDEGYLWFCGRKAERVETAQGVFYPDCVEGVFDRHPKARRTALIAWRAADGTVEPAIVVEPAPGAWPAGRRAAEAFRASLRELGAACEVTRPIRRFFFRRSFPVDVRHNAKIHRLALARELGEK